MKSIIDEFVQDAIQIDRQVTISQILTIRYGELNNSGELATALAQMPSNQMLRCILSYSSAKELAQMLTTTNINLQENHHPTDLFEILGPIEEYYRDKSVEQNALELLAMLRFGEIDKSIKNAIKFSLQEPLNISMKKLYSLTRSELIEQTNCD